MKSRAESHGHWAEDGEAAGVAAGESRPQMGGRFVDSLAREAVLAWAFDAGRLHNRLAYAALRALGGDAGVGDGLRELRVSEFGMGLFMDPFDCSGGGGGFDLCGGSGSALVGLPDGGSDGRPCSYVIPGWKRIFLRWL